MIKESPRIISIDTPWNEKSLQVKSNEILNVIYTEENQLDSLIDQFEENCVNNKVQLSVCRTNNIELIEKLLHIGYLKCEISLEVFSSLRNFEKYPTKGKITIAEYNQVYLKEIKAFAYNDFHFGRFLEDVNIEKHLARKRTELWIDDLNNDPTINCLLGMAKEKFIGCMFYKVFDNKVELILGGVKNSYAHLAQEFWMEVINRLSFANSIASVISASNPSIINLYSELGFKFRKSVIGLHKHRNFDTI